MSTEFIRSREFPLQESTGVFTATSKSTGSQTSSTSYSVKPVELQTTWSRDTLFPLRQRLRARAKARGKSTNFDRFSGGAADVGSSFLTVRKEYTDDGCSTAVLSGLRDWIGTIYRYSGPLMAVNPNGKDSIYYPSYSDSDLRNEMLKLGTTAIARTIPTNPSVGVGQLIGESLERIPALPGAAILGRPGNVSKKFADEYLNYEFGLKPLLSDIDGIVQTVRDSNKILEQLERDSGRLVRRRYSFPVERTVERVDTAGVYPWPPLHASMLDGTSVRSRVRTTEKRMWFSGAYTYYYAQGSDLWSRLRRIEQQGNRLFGLRLSPELAWELAPWSWAADWVTNAGDVIRNISAFSRDGLVLRWGYMMCHMTITDTYQIRYRLYPGGTRTATQTFKTTVKKRVRATPYGFGLDPNWSDLSSRQLAILGALGMSRRG